MIRAAPIWVLGGVLLAGAPPRDVELVVNAGRVLRSGADRFVGINVNYIRDHDGNRLEARPLREALADMGARWLRFPGGEKSDFHHWSRPPYAAPDPVSQGWYEKSPGRRMDFDAYMELVRALKAEPYVVVAYDNEKRTQVSRAQFLEMAVAWVRYANVAKKYGVKYWEIGNENWHNETASPGDMAGIVSEFSRAMKAVDPSIRVGASGNNPDWWARFLPAAAPHIDFVSVSLYNAGGWKGYDHYPRHPRLDLRGTAIGALQGIDRHAPAAHRGRLQVVVAETSSKDFSKDKPWRADNTLGHALVTCDTFGQLLLEPRVASAMLWNTRWMKDAEAANSQWYALDARNRLTPMGRAVAVWGRFAREQMVEVTGAPDALSAYASRAADGRALSVIVINRGYEAVPRLRVAVRPAGRFRQASVHRLSGSGPDDREPRWEDLPPIPVREGIVSGPALPGVSVTVLSLEE